MDSASYGQKGSNYFSSSEVTVYFGDVPYTKNVCIGKQSIFEDDTLEGQRATHPHINPMSRVTLSIMSKFLILLTTNLRIKEVQQL